MKKQNGNWLNSCLLIALAMATWLYPQVAEAATNTVSNLNDSGTNSLRDTIAASASGDTIDFSVSGTITLTRSLVIRSSLTIIGPAGGVTVSGNDAVRIFSIYLGQNVNISGLTIAHGSVTNESGGGGIRNSGRLTVNNCTFAGNAATVSGTTSSIDVYGGAIYNDGRLTANNCTFSGNAATVSGPFPFDFTYGGAIYNDGILAANNCTFFGNSCRNSGGAIYNILILTISNCTFGGNSAGVGGGVHNQDFFPNATLTVFNTIIAGNTGSSSSTDVAGMVTSAGHNLIGKTNGSSGWVGSDLTGSTATPLNPLLGPLQDNGGPTLTMALLPGSAAIDAGDDSITNTLATDQRGAPRKLGAHVDIGAYEAGPSPLVTNTNDSGPGSLRAAILLAAPSDIINFAPNVVGTITLTSGELVIGKNRNINGPGAKVLTISGNNASRVFHITGGASQISNLRIANGHASAGGGGIAMNGGSLTVSNCAITGCYAQGVASQGGGGAIAVVGSPNLVVIGSTLSSNTTPYYGGGLYLFNAPNVSLVNSTVSGNSTLDGTSDEAWGGGIFVGNGSTLNVTNSTIANNSSVNQGGGIYKGFSGTVTLRNSLIAGNSAGGLGPDCKGTFVSAGYNLIGNSSGSTGFGSTGDQLNLNPQIGALADNGGPTLTHALLAGSPAIDKGGSGGPTTDQRGHPRPFNWPAVPDASGGDGSDIGAFERGPPALTITRSGKQVVLSWPASELVFRLQSAAALPAGNTWANVSGNPVLTGGIYHITKNISGTRLFYRLINP